jgi:hypothetical protein
MWTPISAMEPRGRRLADWLFVDGVTGETFDQFLENEDLSGQ